MFHNKKIWIFAFLFLILISAAIAFDDFGYDYFFDSDFGNDYSFDSDFGDDQEFDSDFGDEWSFDSDFSQGTDVVVEEPGFDDPMWDFEDDEFFFDEDVPGPEDYPFQEKVNHAPVITSAPGIIAYVGELYTYQINAVDPDGDSIYYAVEGPEGMIVKTYATHGMVEWVPEETGEFDVKVLALDGRWGLDAQTYTIIVLSRPAPIPEESFMVGDLLITKLRICNEYVKPGDTIEISMNLENTGKEKLEDIRVTAAIQDLAERNRIGPFDLKKRDQVTKRLFIEVPEDAAPGEYYIRFSFSNNDVRRVKYRPITVI
jgi:hypothetical protein